MQQPDRQRIFYGWYIMILAFIANFMSVGTGFYVFNSFMQPLCDTHGWTRTDISFALAAGSFIGIFGQLLYGTLVLRIGARTLMSCGAVLSGFSFIFLGQVEDLPHFYLFYILLLLGNGAYGGIVANTAVNNWFVRKRGTAIGLATAGISFSGVILPFAALILIERTGMASAFFWLGIAIIAVAPLAWFIMRDNPEQCGLQPDGTPSPADKKRKPRQGGSKIKAPVETSSYSEPLWIPATIWKLSAFWKMGIAYAIVMLGVVGVLSQLKPRFTDIGFDDHAATTMLSIAALLGAFGKYFWGMLCDRYDSRRVVAVLMTFGGISLVFSLFEQSVPLLIVFVTVYGFSMGGIMSTFPIVIASFFGRNSFASVARFLALFFLLQMLGYPIAGASFDLTGSYNTAYLFFIVLNFIAAALILSIKFPTPGRH